MIIMLVVPLLKTGSELFACVNLLISYTSMRKEMLSIPSMSLKLKEAAKPLKLQTSKWWDLNQGSTVSEFVLLAAMLYYLTYQLRNR